MSEELLMVTYKGNVLEKLKKCGTKAPFRLNENGDTEQAVEMQICKGAQGMPIEQLKEMFVASIFEDKSLIAKPIKHEWITHFFA